MHLSLIMRVLLRLYIILVTFNLFSFAGLCGQQKTAERYRTFRTVDVTIVGDEEFRKIEGWKTLIHDQLQRASEMFGIAFGVVFEIKTFNAWVSPDDATSSGSLMGDIQSKYPDPDTDIIIAYSLQIPNQKERNTHEYMETGRAFVFERYVLLRYSDESEILSVEGINTLLHELSHIFGAWHSLDTNSVMYKILQPSYITIFDEPTSRMLNLMRDYDFRLGVLGIDSSTRVEISRIYSDNHPPCEENPLGIAFTVFATRYLKESKYDSLIAILMAATNSWQSYYDTMCYDDNINLGILYSMASLFNHEYTKEAVHLFETASKIRPSDPSAYSDLGTHLSSMGKHEEALEQFNKALVIDSTFIQALYGKAMVFISKGQRDSSLYYLQKTSKIDSDYLRARFLIDSLSKVN